MPGYGIGMIDYFSNDQASKFLRIYRLPSIIVITDGRFIHHKLSKQIHFTAHSIKQFAKDSLPSRYITSIKSYVQLRRFLGKWEKTNKVSSP